MSIHKKVKSILNTLLYLINNWVAISLLSVSVWGFLTQLILNMSQDNVLSLSMKILLSGILFLSITSLILSINCIIKINRHYSKLPPQKDIKKIVKYLVKYGSITTMIMMKQLGYSNTKAILYSDILKENDYLCGMFILENPTKEVHYSLGKNGKIFAVKYKLDWCK